MARIIDNPEVLALYSASDLGAQPKMGAHAELVEYVRAPVGSGYSPQQALSRQPPVEWECMVPPSGLALSLAEAQLAARADVDAEGKSPLDIEITVAIKTYAAEAEGVTNRAIMEQVWRGTATAFPGRIELTRPRVMQVEHIKFYDIDGVQRTLDPQDYEVGGRAPGYIVPAPGRSWPVTANKINAVEVQVRCGYGADHTSVPDSIKGFVLARVAEHFSTGKHAENQNVVRLLWPEVVYS